MTTIDNGFDSVSETSAHNAMLDFVRDVKASVTKAVETHNALCEIRAERDSQDQQWGEQNHPMLPSDGYGWLIQGDYECLARTWKTTNAYRAQKGQLAWDGILLEEVYEALCEPDAKKREVELIQVAAVAVAAWEASRRQRLKSEDGVREYLMGLIHPKAAA